jgi:hypothetical protein
MEFAGLLVIGTFFGLAGAGVGLWVFLQRPRWRPGAPGWCSFCRSSYKDCGPLMEGPNHVYICLDCCRLAQRLIEAGPHSGIKKRPAPGGREPL